MDSNDQILARTDYLIRTIWHKYQNFLIPEHSEVSVHQIFFLSYLESQQRCTPSEMAKQFGITLGAVTGFVDRLYKLGLIKRDRSEEDRRQVNIELTPAGKQFVQGFALEREGKSAKLSAELGENGLNNLNQALERLNQALDKTTASN